MRVEVERRRISIVCRANALERSRIQVVAAVYGCDSQGWLSVNGALFIVWYIVCDAVNEAIDEDGTMIVAWIVCLVDDMVASYS
jgi:hypothetical protein